MDEHELFKCVDCANLDTGRCPFPKQSGPLVPACKFLELVPSIEKDLIENDLCISGIDSDGTLSPLPSCRDDVPPPRYNPDAVAFAKDRHGWICPRCDRVLAPYVRECLCIGPQTGPYSADNTVFQPMEWPAYTYNDLKG